MIRRFLFEIGHRGRWIPAIQVRELLGPAGSRAARAAGANAARIVVAAVAVVSAALAQGIPAADGPGAYTVLLKSPSVGERLREPSSSKQAGPLPRRDATSVGFMRRAVCRGAGSRHQLDRGGRGAGARCREARAERSLCPRDAAGSRGDPESSRCFGRRPESAPRGHGHGRLGDRQPFGGPDEASRLSAGRGGHEKSPSLIRVLISNTRPSRMIR